MSSTPSGPFDSGQPSPQDRRPGDWQNTQQPSGTGAPTPTGGWQGGPQQFGQPHQPSPAGGYPGAVTQDERSMAMLAHLSTIAALIISAGWLSFVGPLVVWFFYKDRSPFVRETAAGAFNFNIGINLFMIVGWLLTLTIVGAIVGIPMIIIGAVLQVVMHIIGAMRANRGELYRYPMQLRILN